MNERMLRKTGGPLAIVENTELSWSQLAWLSLEILHKPEAAAKKMIQGYKP